MLQKEVKYFGNEQTSGCNSDDADFIVPTNGWMNAENVRSGSTDAGETGIIESVGSNVLLSTAQPSVTYITIGTADDVPNNRFIYFKYSTTSNDAHKIVCWSVAEGREYDVLLSSQVEGGLDFDKNSLIHSAEIVNGLLYWTDNLNEPKKINIDKAIKANDASYDTDAVAYTFPLTYPTQTLIKRPPFYALSVTKDVDADYENNFIKNEAMQFCAHYRFIDNETSVLGDWSALVPYNAIAETNNFVEVSMPAAEVIDQDIIEVELVVKFGNTAVVGFVIHTWDADDILAHNSGSVPLTFNFYNDISGNTVESATLFKPFDSVPLVSKALAYAKNRLFLGNNVEGYDTPETTSMEIGVATVTDDGSYDAVWGLLTVFYYSGGSIVTSSGYYAMYVPTLGRYFMIDPIEGIDPPDTPVSALDSDIDSTSIDSLAGYITGIYPPAEDYDYFESIFETDPSGDPLLPATLTLTDVDLPVGDTQRSFKSEGSYGGGIVFFDRFRRKCGVVTNATLRVEMPVRTYDTAVFNVGMTWEVSNADAVDEIPDWAYYYAPVRTENLQTRFFTSARAVQMFYVSKDDDGVYDYTHTTYDADRYAVAVDISTLPNLGMGYQYEEGSGDIMKLFFDTTPADQDVSILEQNGKWVLIQANDFGVLGAAVKPLFEIYTPYKPSVSEPYWAVGQEYPVVNPGEADRQYSTTGGLFNGDIYIIERGNTGSTYLTENMSPNDKLWRNWYTDRGWDNYEIKIGQVHKTNSVSWSNTFIQGTRTNGISSWDSLDEKAVPMECGVIQKLQLTSKVSDQGNVMLSICTSETLSLYLSEVQLVGAQGNAYVAQSDEVIGTMYTLKGGFGTVNPESVRLWQGNVYWACALRGKIVQYSTNGLFPISEYKLTRFWKQFFDTYLSMTTEEIEALGSRPFIFCGIDPRHNEVLFSIPKLLETPPKGYLIDYPEMIYPWDIWDGQAKTIVYPIDAEPDHWHGAYNIPAEWFCTHNNELYAFKYGHLWQHNQTDSYCNFFGVQYKSRIMPVYNMLGSEIKTYANISLQANLTPTLTYFRSEVPYVQASDIMDYEWTNLEGFIYALIHRNKIVPTFDGYTLDGLLTAERIRTYALRTLLEFTVTTTPLQLRICQIEFSISKGH